MSSNSYNTKCRTLYWGLLSTCMSFLVSCDYFDYPQPYGSEPLRNFPSALKGRYISEDINEPSTVVIGESTILFTSFKDGKFRLTDTKKIGESYYVAHKGDFNKELVCELIHPRIVKDSIFGDVVIEDLFKLGSNCQLMKVNEFHILNFEFSADNQSAWYPVLIDNFGDNYRGYYLSDDFSESLKDDPDVKGTRLRNLSTSDILDIFSKRSSSLKLAWEFDTRNKIFRIYK